MPGDWADELAFAEKLADRADAISTKHFRRRDTRVRNKPDGTPVTDADESIERALREEIARAFPEHAIFGEEEGATGDNESVRWILDPIDGTKNYSWGIPVWATLIALEVDERIVCGVASAPALGERYTASRGGGAHRNGDPIHVSDIDDLSKARVGFTNVADPDDPGFGRGFHRIIRTSAHDRGIGDFYGHVLVASGSLDVMAEPMLAPWDIGPLIVIVEEAGGRLTDLDGRAQLYGGSCLSTNGVLHDEVLAILNGDGR